MTHPNLPMRKPSATPAKAKPQSRLLVVLSDLHCGSDVGLLPKKVILDDGQELGYGINKWQEWLWTEWLKMEKWVDEVSGDEPYDLLLNGDLVENFHHRSDEIVSVKIVEHCRIAIEALQKVVGGAARVHCTRGTESHTLRMEEYMMKTMGRGTAHDFIQWELNGVLCDARHHFPTTARQHLEAGPLSVIAANNRSNAARCGHKPARIFLRGHRHVPGIYSDGEVLVGVTGAWQGLTRFGRKVVPDSIPRPSCLILDARNTPHGELPTVHHRVFNPPQHLVAHCI